MIARLLFGLLLAIPLHAQPFSPQDPVFSQVCSPLLQGCAGAWRLEEASGIRYDLSGHNINLTSNNSVGQTVGKVGNCSSFASASSQSLTAASSNSLQYLKTQPMSVVAWVKLTNNSSAQAVLGHYESTTFRGWWFGTSDNGGVIFQIESSSSATRYRIGSTTITNGAWHFIAATYDGSVTTNGISLYADNALQTVAVTSSTSTLNDIDNTAAFAVGSRGSVGQFPIPANGLIDEPIVWPRVITSAELISLYNAGFGTHTPWAAP